jgi:DDE family transposase
LQLSFFNGGYNQHMYHPLLIFERRTGCLLAARLRPGRVVSNARIIPLLLRIVPRLQREFPNVRIQLRADAGFATPLLYEFCEFFGIQYNNSPLLVKREYWYSPLLGINLSGSRSDPRFGTQNFEVTDVVIGEPDAKLFAVPSGSKMINLKSPAGTGESLQAPQSN